ncbi:MAG: hypothetical protein J6P88_03240, partial [Clostridia bacterium]|nr:hypothetical protein [Clostridia bacterium]
FFHVFIDFLQKACYNDEQERVIIFPFKITLRAGGWRRFRFSTVCCGHKNRPCSRKQTATEQE